jgi:hypothetical protein
MLRDIGYELIKAGLQNHFAIFATLGAFARNFTSGQEMQVHAKTRRRRKDRRET